MEIRLNESLAIGEEVFYVGMKVKIINIQYGRHYVRVWVSQYEAFIDLPNGDKLRFLNQIPVVL